MPNLLPCKSRPGLHGWRPRGVARAAGLGALLLAVTSAGVRAEGWETSGHLRGFAVQRPLAGNGPLAAANALVPGLATVEGDSQTAQAELRAARQWGSWSVHGIATLQAQHVAGAASRSKGWLNEAVLSGKVADWQWSAGRKVVSWDVGYGFRPNDVVQQEVRRVLTPVTLQGRPVAMLERFDASAALSLVWVNPTHERAATGAEEPALAGRYYQRIGAADAYAFARHGARTGASAGAAVSWVASDAVELHASWRAYAHADTVASTARGAQPLPANPWGAVLSGRGQQALLGGTWTSESQLSVLGEVWWDGTAASDAQWRDWSARNAGLPAWAALGAPAAAVAGNLAWQSGAWGNGTSLRRRNVFARVSWQHDAWAPALDVLWTPADRARLVTLSLAWQGDRVRLEGGWRTTLGPEAAVLRQMPVQRQAYAVATWAF